jgi:peptidoglycan/xylan/chitin deacetylase (PgdA/CDA1 family)
MNLVAFSIRTKGARNFARRLGTVFTRFGFSERKIRRALHSIAESLQQYDGAPTFFIPAVVLERHPALIKEIAREGAEIGIHGYVHNDYRTLSEGEQYKQTERAISVFQQLQVPFQGFRNPYFSWNDASLRVFTALDFTYESNETILHDDIDLDSLSPLQRSGLEKSQELFQAKPSSAYALRPHFEGKLLRIPASIPDDEILFDRLRITNPENVGHIWSKGMQRAYNLGGLYSLNLHPERGLLCKQALDKLLLYARSLPLPVWLARQGDIAQWWIERGQFRLNITPLAPDLWSVEALCNPRATVLARNLEVEDQSTKPWSNNDVCIPSHCFRVQASKCPSIALSLQTPQEVIDFMQEQGYPVAYCSQEEAHTYSLYLDLPGGFGNTSEKQAEQRSALVQRVEELEAPLVHFGCWPDGNRAALGITSDIDSVTIQDFFLRVVEVYRHR